MTANNGIDLRAGRSLELLEELKATVVDFSRREEALVRELRTKRYAVTRKYQEATKEIESQESRQVREVDERFSEVKQRITALYESRKARIQKAQSAGIRHLPKRAEDTRGRYLGDLQQRKFRAERRLAEAKQEAAAMVAARTEQLAEPKALVDKLIRRARKYFSGAGALQKLLTTKGDAASVVEESRVAAKMLELAKSAEEELADFRGKLVPRMFSAVPLPGLLVVALAVGVAVALFLGGKKDAFVTGGAVGGGLMVLTFLLHQLGMRSAAPDARSIASKLIEATNLHSSTLAEAMLRSDREIEKAKEVFDAESASVQHRWGMVSEVGANFEKSVREKLKAQAPRAAEKNESHTKERLAAVQAERNAQAQQFIDAANRRKDTLTAAYQKDSAVLDQEEEAAWADVENAWKQKVEPLYGELGRVTSASAAQFPPWSRQLVDHWSAPKQFIPAATFGRVGVDLATFAGSLPKEPRLALPGAAQFSVPLGLTFPGQGSLLLETNDAGGQQVSDALNSIIFRLLATTPPGKLAFTIIDPVGLGQNFAGLMHLADYEETLINRRIWTQRDQIEERLAELNEHIEKVIQMYLRNEYETITEYNAQAGSVAEKYHFLVVADFPAGFSDMAAKRLQSIATSGARCGVFTLIHWDHRQPMPDGFSEDDLRQSSIPLRREKGHFVLSQFATAQGLNLTLDPPPSADLAVELVHKIGQASVDSNRVEVPFSQISPRPEERWTNDTTNELRIPIGRTGATKQQYLAIGKGTRQHALFAGKTGSGKSTLFHVIITNLSLSCSPEQVEFYLIDFKKGVEFKCYASKHLPHARVVAIESDREFALSVLQRVDDELKRRGDLFRKLGAQDLAGYKRAGGMEAMPRSLLIIDEFQEFFVEDDQIAQSASLLFDRIVRQGRAFGIHVLLGSQTLGGAYSLARATLGQMVIRVALQCNEADAYLIMDDNNPAPRLLSRPGEGIYNDAAGAVEGNSPFQVVWLPDGERDALLDQVNFLAEKRGMRKGVPIVFEGNAPADIRENELLRAALEKPPTARPPIARCWFGAPNSIKGPTEAAFHRQSGNHLLIVGQRDEAALTMLGAAMLALAAQHPVAAAKFLLVHSTAPGTPEGDFLEQIGAALPHDVKMVRPHEVGEAMSELAAEHKARSTGETDPVTAPSIFVLIHGLHKFKKLRQEDEFSFSMGDSESGGSPGAQFQELITEGSSLGLHILTTVDTLNNVNRSMSRKAQTEFEMRVVFQMSANDSASLIDSPKASNLGLHRALFYNEQEGTLETFRPYAMPDTDWISSVAHALKGRIPAPAKT